MTAGEVALRPEAESGWRLAGRARIDDRPSAGAYLTIRADGTWFARVSTFTLGDVIDLYFEASGGGHFCGPAFVGRSHADSDPLTMQTELLGHGPLLVVDPRTAAAELPGEEVVDAEVVESPAVAA